MHWWGGYCLTCCAQLMHLSCKSKSRPELHFLSSVLNSIFWTCGYLALQWRADSTVCLTKRPQTSCSFIQISATMQLCNTELANCSPMMLIVFLFFFSICFPLFVICRQWVGAGGFETFILQMLFLSIELTFLVKCKWHHFM